MLLKESPEQELRSSVKNKKVILTSAGLFLGAASELPETALSMGH